uniref:Acyl-CoA dependent delta5-desaturase n=1 Tax=Mantoniella squamata TaxID=13608 RepID=B5DC82_MANSQ|nr:Acyl-CoA dependent delta5-desaturase [Mantoniella squamata]
MPPRETTTPSVDHPVMDRITSLTGGAGAGVPRKYTTADVEKHSTPDDCWLIVHGKVYDVTSFVPRHPGGNMIWVKAGGDCTQLFDSYHPIKTQAVLDKYYIGEVQRVSGDEKKIIEYNDDMKKGKFYMDCKVAVEKYFKDTKQDPRVHVEMYVKTFVILAGVAVCHYCSFFLTSSFLVSAVFAALHGMWKAEVGVSIQHDANHGAYGKSRGFLHAMQLTLDVVGASSFMWRQQHVVGHHAYTNVEGVDPDIRCAPEKDIRRVNEHQPHESYHPLQHVYLFFAYGLLSFKSCFADDFNAWASGRIGWVKVAKFTRGEAVSFWGSKVLWAFYYLYLPATYSPHSGLRIVALVTITEVITGWLLAFMFQVAHVVGDVRFFKLSEEGKLNLGWGESQLYSSADFAHGSKFWMHFSGGLNYQVAHHLFPGVCHCHYPAIAPIIMKVAKEYGLEYAVYPTFWSALSAHFTHLKNVGQKTYVPSLQTIG